MNTSSKDQSNNVAKLASFAVLLVIILVVGALFYRVMQTFILPLFLAALTVVIFKPVHGWVLKKCGQRKQLAAMLTTSAIAIMIFGPITMLASSLWKKVVSC